MIKPDLGKINDIVSVLERDLRQPASRVAGREIGMGIVQSKAKWSTDTWLLWTDHRRDSNHRVIIEAFLQFHDPKMETWFRVKYPELCG